MRVIKMTILPSKRLQIAIAALLVTLWGSASAQARNTNTTIQEGRVNINNTFQWGDSNANATYQNGMININRTIQLGGNNGNETGQFGRVTRNQTVQGSRRMVQRSNTKSSSFRHGSDRNGGSKRSRSHR